MIYKFFSPLDLEEIAEWIDPQGFIPAKSEVVYLIENIGMVSKKMSLVTIFGHYILRNDFINFDIFHEKCGNIGSKIKLLILKPHCFIIDRF